MIDNQYFSCWQKERFLKKKLFSSDVKLLRHLQILILLLIAYRIYKRKLEALLVTLVTIVTPVKIIIPRFGL